jgi:amino acid adenylation domain-containing protein/non-ribosomal peptide synthase protein (TIGR01720 family)
LKPQNFAAVPGLSIAQQALLAALLEAEGVVLPERQTIAPRPGSEAVPLSFAQQRLWFLAQLEPHTRAYHSPVAIRLSGPLSVTVLAQALGEIVRRHEALRTTFRTVAGQPVQLIAAAAPQSLPLVDLSACPPAEREDLVRRLMQAETRRLLDLTRGPLWRSTLLRLNPAQHVMLCTMHHMVTDAWSIGILMREMEALYAAFAAGTASPLAEFAVHYADFARWQRQWLQGDVLETQLAYWRQQLADLPVLHLPGDRPRPGSRSLRGAHAVFRLPMPHTAALKALSQQHGVTLFMTLLAAFQVLLQRYTGQDDLVVGTPIANRTRVETEGLIGFFANTLVLRTSLAGNPTFCELLTRVREVTVAAYAHQDVPFEALVEALQPRRDLSQTPLFQVMFVFQNTLLPTLKLPGLTLTTLDVHNGTAKFDCTLTLADTEQGLTGSLEYSTDLFTVPTIRRLLGHFTTLLEGVVANPQQRLAELPLLTAAERQQLLVDWNATAAAYPPDACLHRLFEAQVARTPEAIALVYEQQQVTYQELNQRANRLAHHLQGLGVGPEVLVGIFLERSLELIIGLLGILKAGAAYVPLDPSYPPERLQFMLAEAQVFVVLTQASRRTQVHGDRVLCLDSDWPAVAGKSTANPVPQTVAAHVAYVMYTSGSTGTPKGVMIPHGGICNRLLWMQEAYGLTAADNVLQKTPVGFDVSVWEIFWPLITGARLVMARPEGQRDSAYLVETIVAQQITTLHFVPSMLAVFLEAPGLTACRCLRQVMCSGEVLPVDLQERFFTRLAAALHNLYGPTEASVDVTFWACQRQSSLVPIGRPIANTQLYVLDHHGQPDPPGVAGVLHIGGIGLARGYVRRPARTAETFVPHPYSAVPGARLYQTGDVVRYLADGNLVFLGRNDRQVKIHGCRIEPGEIEAVLGQHPALREVAVVAHQDSPGAWRLVAYVVPHQEPAPTQGELRDFLRARLPDYMVPAVFVLLAALPLTPNGKVDRRALPAPDHSRSALERSFVAPRTPVEERLTGIWAEVLGVDPVGIHDNFFALGGDSILSLLMIARANLAGLRFTPRQIFENQTVAELAAVVDTSPALHLPQGPVIGPVPLTPIQHWFFESEPVNVHHFNQAVLLQVRRALSPTLLEQVVRHLLWQHDALRLRYRRIADGWSQECVAPQAEVPFSHLDLSALAAARQSIVIEAVAATLQGSLNLCTGPLLRVAYFTLGEQRPGRLLLIVHHLAVDGVSWRILLTDLQLACEQLSRGEVLHIPPKTTSFQTWAERLLQQAQSAALRQELEVWKPTRPAAFRSLPVDYTGGPNTVASAHLVTVALSPSETRALLQEVPLAYHTRIHEVLLTALAQAFCQWTGSAALLLDVEGHGREALFIEDDVDLSRTVGWFTTIFPVLLELACAATPGEALLAVQAQLRRLPHHGIGYGMLRYLSQDAAIPRKLRALSPAEVHFNYLGQFDQLLPASAWFALAGEASGPPQSQRERRRYVLEILGSIRRQRLQLQWTYSAQVHRRDTIEALAHACLEALRALLTYCQSAPAGGHTLPDLPLARLAPTQLAQAFDEVTFEGDDV